MQKNAVQDLFRVLVAGRCKVAGEPFAVGVVLQDPVAHHHHRVARFQRKFRELRLGVAQNADGSRSGANAVNGGTAHHETRRRPVLDESSHPGDQIHFQQIHGGRAFGRAVPARTREDHVVQHPQRGAGAVAGAEHFFEKDRAEVRGQRRVVPGPHPVVHQRVEQVFSVGEERDRVAAHAPFGGDAPLRAVHRDRPAGPQDHGAGRAFHLERGGRKFGAAEFGKVGAQRFGADGGAVEVHAARQDLPLSAAVNGNALRRDPGAGQVLGNAGGQVGVKAVFALVLFQRVVDDVRGRLVVHGEDLGAVVA